MRRLREVVASIISPRSAPIASRAANTRFRSSAKETRSGTSGMTPAWTAPHRRFAPAEDGRLVGFDLHQQRLAGLILPARIGQRIGHVVAQAENTNFSDLHDNAPHPNSRSTHSRAFCRQRLAPDVLTR